MNKALLFHSLAAGLIQTALVISWALIYKVSDFIFGDGIPVFFTPFYIFAVYGVSVGLLGLLLYSILSKRNLMYYSYIAELFSVAILLILGTFALSLVTLK